MKTRFTRLSKTSAILGIVLLLLLTISFLGCDSSDGTGDQNIQDTTPIESPEKQLIKKRIEQFVSCYNNGDMDGITECFDTETRKAFIALLDVLGSGVVDLGDIFSLNMKYSDTPTLKCTIESISITDGKALVVTSSNIQSTDNSTYFFVMLYENDDWYINNMTQDIPEDMPIYNAEGSPTYAISSYAINEEAGYFTKLKHEIHAVGDKIELSAEAKAGYTFDGWYSKGKLLSSEESFTYVTQNKNTTLEARFVTYVVNTYSNTDNNGLAGSFSKFFIQNVSAGDKVQLEATVNKGYIFEGWFENDILISDSLTYTFTMPKENVEIEARYKNNSYTLTVKSNDMWGWAGTYTKISQKTVSVGEKVTLKATANKGYNFYGWYSNGELLSSSPTYEFVMGNNDTYIEASFNYNILDVYASSDVPLEYAGTCTEIYGEKVSIGETVSLVATLNEGYIFEGWFIDYECVCPDLEYDFVMGDESVTITAIFKRQR